MTQGMNAVTGDPSLKEDLETCRGTGFPVWQTSKLVDGTYRSMLASLDLSS
jgi:hypothetical protein